MKLPELLILIGLLSSVSLVLYARLMRNMLKRSRWLMITLVLVFSFTTPGEYLPAWPNSIAPTYEGIAMGVLQLARLVIMLAGLALLLGATTREMLMGGLYTLLRPLSILGISPDRFTARVWLTLDYVERDPVQAGQRWKVLENFRHDNPLPEGEVIALSIPNFGYRDLLTGGILILSVWWWIV